MCVPLNSTLHGCIINNNNNIMIYINIIMYILPSTQRHKYDVKQYLLLHSRSARVQHAPVLGFPRLFWRQRTLDVSTSSRAHPPDIERHRYGTPLYFRTGRDNLFLPWRFRACDDDTTKVCVWMCVSTTL